MAVHFNTGQQQAFREIEKGHNLAITGQAGTGKSFLIAEAAKRLSCTGKKVAITATTGIAASQFTNGLTLHRWSGILDGRFSNDEAVRRVRGQSGICTSICTTDVLIVDEVSMLSARTFEQVEHVCRQVRGCPRFFGGLQVICVGDFLQLRPVPNMLYQDPGQYVLSSPIFRAGVPHKISLETVMRQEEKKLVTAVNELERGVPSEETNTFLQSLKRPLPVDTCPKYLFGTNFEVDYFNAEKLAAEKGHQHTYMSEDTGTEQHLKNLRVKRRIPLKCQCPVVLLQNLSSSLVNGLQGMVIALEEDGPVVAFPTATVKLQKVSFSLFDPVSNTVLAERMQIPLALGYALTVHKAQGLTLDPVVVNCSNIYQPGQLGVAVGRAKSTEGLQVLNFRAQRCCQHPDEIMQYVDAPGNVCMDDLSCCQKVAVDFAVLSMTHPGTDGAVIDIEGSEMSEDELDYQMICDLEGEVMEQQSSFHGRDDDGNASAKTSKNSSSGVFFDELLRPRFEDGTGPKHSTSELHKNVSIKVAMDAAALSMIHPSTDVAVIEDSEMRVDEFDLLQGSTSEDMITSASGALATCVVDAFQLLEKLRVSQPRTREQQSINIFVETLTAHPSASLYIQNLFAKVSAAYSTEHNKFLQWFHKFISSPSPKENLRSLLKDALKEDHRSADFEVFYGFLLTTVRKEVISTKTTANNIVEETRTLHSLPTSAHGKVRYVGGFSVAKQKARHMKTVRTAIERGALQVEHKRRRQKIVILDTLTTTQGSISVSSRYPESINETARRQNLACGLTNITDPTFEFFLHFEETRIQLYQQYAAHGQDVLKIVHDKIVSDSHLLERFKTAVENDVSESVQIRFDLVEEVFQELSCLYLRVTDNEFRKQQLEQFGKEKLMEHRKRVLLRQSKQQKPLSVQSIQLEGRDVSIDKLKAALESGHISQLTKAEIVSICHQLFGRKLNLKLTKEKLIAEIAKGAQEHIHSMCPCSVFDTPTSALVSDSEPYVKGISAITGKGKGTKRRHEQ